MRIARLWYGRRGRPIPYYADYPLRLIVWKVLRKWLNVVLIPNLTSARLRVVLYRLIGFHIGRHVFIGMKCYLDDTDPGLITIEDNASISYGVYFAVHGVNQDHTPIRICENAKIGMRVMIISGRNGVTIGRNAIVGAGSLVHRSVPDNAVVAGCPIRPVRLAPAELLQDGPLPPTENEERTSDHERQRLERGSDRSRLLGQESGPELCHGQALHPEVRL
jgi:acetyltransferase-like isoleucine patch superfamily enzyme